MQHPLSENEIIQAQSRYNCFIRNPNENSHIKYYTNNIKKNDVPKIVKTKDEMYEEMRKAVRTMAGRNFVLGMFDDGEFKVWKRQRQPCQGGELRKYGITHDDCTRPRDPRPTDLSYPFPDGKPLAIGIGYNYGSYDNEAINTFKMFINPMSIYRRAYTNEANIEIVKRKEGEGFAGFIALDADLVDPTVFVHLAIALGYNHHLYPLYRELEEYITIPEFFLLKKYGNFQDNKKFYWHRLYSSHDHKQNIHHINLKNFLKGGIQATKDLSGGSFGDRTDYNRPDLNLIFKTEVGKNIDVNTIFAETFTQPMRAVSNKELIDLMPKFREVVSEKVKKKVA